MAKANGEGLKVRLGGTAMGNDFRLPGLVAVFG
ncbi:hypothetical protein COLO4_38270 [Corchorus olitorius]|uniref:Uncharacterized protein n=1 Tax=Corchorus olitorius TaxID=93759 RepID=A0A1R3FW04_9ROSI|nr:hypothetical protein COLO4_38270 [Corchorus olitorius]